MVYLLYKILKLLNYIFDNIKYNNNTWTYVECKPWRTLKFGAGEGIRTLDFNLGKVALYP